MSITNPGGDDYPGFNPSSLFRQARTRAAEFKGHVDIDNNYSKNT